MAKVANENSKIMCEICSKLTMKKQGQCHRNGSGVCIINDEQICASSMKRIAAFVTLQPQFNVKFNV